MFPQTILTRLSFHIHQQAIAPAQTSPMEYAMTRLKTALFALGMTLSLSIAGIATPQAHACGPYGDNSLEIEMEFLQEDIAYLVDRVYQAISQGDQETLAMELKIFRRNSRT